jgi:hypothetical protein
MIESPFIQELRAEVHLETTREALLIILHARFGSVPEEVQAGVQSIQQLSHVKKLIVWSLQCPNLQAFRTRQPSSSPP